MAKYLRDVQGIATISGKIAAKLSPAAYTGEFAVSQVHTKEPNMTNTFQDISNLIGSEEPQTLQVPIDNNLKFRLNIREGYKFRKCLKV